MQKKPKVGLLTTFGGSDEAYSLVVVVKSQLEMLLEAEYYPVLFVCPSFMGTGIWSDNHIETRKTVSGDADHVEICTALRKMVTDIDVMICHDIVFLSPQHDEWAKSIRILAKEFPNIKWLHWQHSRGDHAPIEPVPNSDFCYPNSGDLPHVAQINSTDIEHVHYIPHPLDFNYLGWNELAIRIAEDYDFPFVDISMVYPTRLDRQKQVEKAIHVFAGMKKMGRSVCLLVADAYATGEHFKEYKADCMKIAKEVGLTEKEFAFLGEVYEECVIATPRQTVKALFEMSSIFMQVSTSETSSLVAMEACLAGNMLVLNADFQPIHHLYGKAITMPFNGIFNNPPVKYYRHVKTADRGIMKVEDEQFFWDNEVRDTIVPILDAQMTIALKRQQLRERWPSRVMRDYLEPLLLRDWKPELPKCEGDPDVTAIITTLDNLPLLQRQVDVLMKECGQIIIVDNGSKDGTTDWAYANPFKGGFIITRENKGAGPGRNDGLKLWDEHPTPYTLMIDGGILPPVGGVRAMKSYLERHPETSVVSPEIASCYTTEESEATLIFNKETIDDNHTFFQSCLSGTAYCLCRADAWRVRFSEDGPFAEPGWGVDDNEMQYRWNAAGIKHADFTQEEGMILFRKASGSFKRLFEETGIWPNQHGSVYEKRLVKTYQDYPQYCYFTPRISCVVLGWNEHPMIAKVVKRLHDEFVDTPHEIIVVNNGSTDGTKNWIDTYSLRQHHGDVVIDAQTNEIIRRTPENEEFWTGNFKHVDFDENMGTGHGFNAGFSECIGEFIFYICGDMLPVPGSVRALYQYLQEHPEASYAGVNAWVSQGETQEVEEFQPFTQELGLGNYAYSYAMIRRDVWDAGVRFADRGPFEGAGAGYEEIEFANMMYSKGCKGVMFNYPAYYHQRRDGVRSGIEERTDEQGVDDRKKWLMTRWNKVSFEMEHIEPNPPERHLRKVAVMNNLVPDHPGPAGYLAMALRDIGCHVIQYNSNVNVPADPLSGGYDDYIFVDDGDGNHFDCPEWAHPSKYWAIDMVIPGNDYIFTPNIESYVEHGKTFDQFFCTTIKGVEYAKSKGLNAIWLPMAASPEIHKHYDSTKEHDWVACWHNCGDRIAYGEAAMKAFPNGWLGYAEGDNYALYMNKGKCALNVSRVNEVNMRVMEVTMMGVPLITDRVQGLDQYGYVENEHYLGHSSIDEMLEKIQWVKDHPEEANIMAVKARVVAMAHHTYYRRALKMFGW
jgi:glycosyltransferase involved in cell wall biosynthesis